MPLAYYMQFLEGHRGAPDRIGGIPTHLPLAMPKDSYKGDELAFLAQFYCEGIPWAVSSTLCIQLYQSKDVGMGGDPCPVAIRVPVGAVVNTHGLGKSQVGILPHDIAWEQRMDPEFIPEFPDDLPLYQSKVGGLCLDSDLLTGSDKFVLQLKEQPGELNLAGMTCIVYWENGQFLKAILA